MNNNKWKLTSTFVNDNGKLMEIYSHIDNSKKIDKFLDRYDYKFENYIASKFRIAMNQTKEDYLIYDVDDEVIINHLKKNPVQSILLPFSLIKTIKSAFLNFENCFSLNAVWRQ